MRATPVSLVEAIGKGADQVLAAGFTPDANLLNSATWTPLRTANYDNGAIKARTSRACRPRSSGPVYLPPATAAGGAYMLASNYCELRDVQQVTAELGYTGTQFTSTVATLLAEMHVAALYRAVGAAAKVSVTP